MLRQLLKKWDEIQFDAMISGRIKTTEEMLEKYGPPTADEVDTACGMMAKALVVQKFGKEDASQIAYVKEKVKRARAEIQGMFEIDGYSKEFSYALSHVCVGWDAAGYKKGKRNHNLTLNCMLKVHTKYSGLFNEEAIFKL